MAEANSSASGEQPANARGFYVTPKLDCPHVQPVVDGDQTVGVGTTDPCMECNNVGENWLCLSCGEVHCSRYVNEHMVHHNAQTGHPITISYADISVWCYSCDSYIDSDLLKPIIQTVALAKFGS